MRNFTIEDFSGSGQYLLRMSPEEIHCKENNKPFRGYSDTGYLSTIIKKVGYIVDNYNLADGGNVYTLTDISDGLTTIGNYTNKDPQSNNYEKVIWGGSDSTSGKQKLVDWLNNPELSQEHRFATQEEIVRVVLYQKSRWR